MRPGNSDVKTPSLNGCTAILNHSEADLFNIKHRSKRKNLFVCGHRPVRRHRLAAGRDSCSRSTLMRKIFCAVCSSVKFTRVFELDFTVEYSIHLAKQFVEQIISL